MQCVGFVNSPAFKPAANLQTPLSSSLSVSRGRQHLKRSCSPPRLRYFSSWCKAYSFFWSFSFSGLFVSPWKTPCNGLTSSSARPALPDFACLSLTFLLVERSDGQGLRRKDNEERRSSQVPLWDFSLWPAYMAAISHLLFWVLLWLPR